jgi:hypothetical protein
LLIISKTCPVSLTMSVSDMKLRVRPQQSNDRSVDQLGVRVGLPASSVSANDLTTSYV